MHRLEQFELELLVPLHPLLEMLAFAASRYHADAIVSLKFIYMNI
eukprot:UN06613